MQDPRVKIIVDVVAKECDVTSSAIMGKSREIRAARPRQMAMTLCVRLLSISTIKVGRAFGRDHTTVTYAINAMNDRCTVVRDFAAVFDRTARCARAALETAEVITLACDTLKAALINRVKADPVAAVAAICAALNVNTTRKHHEPD